MLIQLATVLEETGKSTSPPSLSQQHPPSLPTTLSSLYLLLLLLPHSVVIIMKTYLAPSDKLGPPVAVSVVLAADVAAVAAACLGW